MENCMQGPPPSAYCLLPPVRRSAHAKDVGRHCTRMKIHIIPRAAPHVTSIGEQVVDLIGLPRIKAQFLERQRYPSRLRVARVEVHYY